jgi:uncharacterized protein YuzE
MDLILKYDSKADILAIKLKEKTSSTRRFKYYISEKVL